MSRILSILTFLSLTLGLMAQVNIDQMSLLPDELPTVGDTLVVAAAPSMPNAAEGEGAVVDSLVTDSLAVFATDSSVVVPVEPPVPSYMLRSAYRSWRRSHPLQPLKRKPRNMARARRQADSLMAVVRTLPVSREDMLYLYDMRLPLINSGYVPVDSSTQFFQDVQLQEDMAERDDLPISHFDDVYMRQRRNEEHRHWARYQYAAEDPRRFRYARRKFDVPTTESRVLDTKSSVQETRLVDDIDVDFGNASLEDFGQYFVVKADKWHWKGDHTLTLQQTALSDNWYKGGDNNMTVSGEQKITISRYDEDAITTFETILDLKLSGYYTKADTIHRMRVNDNEFTLTAKYGYKAWKKWYYTAQLYAKTPVFDYYAANSNVCKSTFLSPLEMNLSFGVDYQYTSPHKAFVYSLLLAPVSYDFKAVRSDRVDVTSYGIEEGHSTLHQIGSSITTKFDWKISDDVSWSTRLYYFTSYTSTKMEFENTFNFQIGRFFTARIYAYPRFDDNSDTELEIKEMLTIGFSYQW